MPPVASTSAAPAQARCDRCRELRRNCDHGRPCGLCLRDPEFEHLPDSEVPCTYTRDRPLLDNKNVTCVQCRIKRRQDRCDRQQPCCACLQYAEKDGRDRRTIVCDYSKKRKAGAKQASASKKKKVEKTVRQGGDGDGEGEGEGEGEDQEPDSGDVPFDDAMAVIRGELERIAEALEEAGLTPIEPPALTKEETGKGKGKGKEKEQ